MKRSGFKQPTPEQAKEKMEARRLKFLTSQNALGRKKKTKANLLRVKGLRSKLNGNLKKSPKKKTTLSKLKKELWQLCRKVVKKQFPHVCYTCGKPLLDGSSDFHTGHFIPSSICSTELRYDIFNLKPQCSACNVWKSGDWVSYEKHLLQDYGEHFVKELKVRNELTKGLMYREQWYESKIQEYQALLESL